MAELLVVGIGPGSYEMMTAEAAKALAGCEVIAGYQVYLDLVRPYFPDKEYVSTPMRREEERCREGLRLAMAGRAAALVCSGDSGVYGLAGLVLELLPEYPGVKVKVIPGVTAALAGGAVLGAPLCHDFAVISLSDLLTPWEKSEARISAAAAADFVIVFYNPSSKKRHDYLRRACALILEHQPPRTVCGLVENIGRDGQRARILSLEELRDTQVNMFTTVFVGNSQTREIGGRMVTPRGYEL